MLFVWNTLIVSLTVSTTILLHQDPLRLDVACLQGMQCEGTHSSTMCFVVWWLSPQGQVGDLITPVERFGTSGLAISQTIQIGEQTSRWIQVGLVT